MKTGYTDILFEMSHTLCQSLLEQEPDIAQKVHELDGEVNKILRRLGFFVVSLVLAELGSRVIPLLLLYEEKNQQKTQLATGKLS